MRRLGFGKTRRKASAFLFVLLGCYCFGKGPFVEEKAVAAQFATTNWGDNEDDSKGLLSVAPKAKKDIQEIFGEIVEDVREVASLDGSVDFAYVCFQTSGFAMVFQDTLEVLEMSPTGNVAWTGDPSSWCYGGPGNYLIKDDTVFFDILRKQTFVISKEDAFRFSSTLRGRLHINPQTFNSPKPRSAQAFSFEKQRKAKSGSAPGINNDFPISANGGDFYSKLQIFYLRPYSRRQHGRHVFFGGLTAFTRLPQLLFR